MPQHPHNISVNVSHPSSQSPPLNSTQLLFSPLLALPFISSPPLASLGPAPPRLTFPLLHSLLSRPAPAGTLPQPALLCFGGTTGLQMMTKKRMDTLVNLSGERGGYITDNWTVENIYISPFLFFSLSPPGKRTPFYFIYTSAARAPINENSTVLV